MNQIQETIAEMANEVAHGPREVWPYSEWTGTSVATVERDMAALQETAAAISPLLQLLEADLCLKGSDDASGKPYKPLSDYYRGGMYRALKVLVDRQHAILEDVCQRVAITESA